MNYEHLFVFADSMLSNIRKTELVECVSNLRAAASMNKDFLLQKRKNSIDVAQVQSDQDEHTTSGLVFKRKGLNAASPIKHSHSDSRAPNREVITIQEREEKCSQSKSLWDPNFDIPAHGESCFFPDKDKVRDGS